MTTQEMYERACNLAQTNGLDPDMVEAHHSVCKHYTKYYLMYGHFTVSDVTPEKALLSYVIRLNEITKTAMV